MFDDALLSIFDRMPLIASFLAGLLAFLSPCVLPLLPAYMSYISQSSLDELKGGQFNRFAILLKACLFVLGFGLIFWLIGASMAKIMHNYLAGAWVRYVSGGIVILFGLHFLGILRFNFLYRSKNFNLSFESKNKFLQALMPFILGAGFALGWTPCIGPIFTSIVILSGSQQVYGMALLIVFIVGFGLPFLVVALMVQRALEMLKKARRYAHWFEIASGVVLVLMGVLIISGKMDDLGAFLLQF
ncbi:Cytochrome c biogenesis protein CcdA [Helicobacter bizzozeronii]|uniref:cytochrome c biogenesis protein CcdA n=1 Tax=Helicobacter bizzozeronii TaxID=56877 RepID=UPI00244D8430|nr:cytochrome c biogenesis protein CcdA [Helicobacter bizzozeronii]GMB93826.1 Cytochrome c biogenesis protein CcdA [Helicobacter bizzozeronii]GMT38940.1 Cytochrome c biogenesis protein CcdA [Helicobacter bizzozeronii]